MKEILKRWLRVLLELDKPQPSPISQEDELSHTYIFDFRNPTNSVSWRSDSNDSGFTMSAHNDQYVKSTKKIKIKPIDVLTELETIPTPFSMSNLDDKLNMLNDKCKLITQHQSKREVNAVISRLKNRKQYIEHKLFFDKFQNTTDEKIDTLLEKYDLVMKPADIFIPEFPDDATKIMTEYTNVVSNITTETLIFYVIAEDKLFKKTYEKRDPILLVQSPFGFFYQILGAWDEEMLLLGEL